MRVIFLKLLLTIVAMSNNANCQTTIDTNKLVLNSKMKLTPFAFNAYEDLDYFEAYLKFDPEITFLDSKGFDSNLVFYSLRMQDTVIITKKIGENLVQQRPFFQFKDQNVIFVYDRRGNEVYRLTGDCNEMCRFLSYAIGYYNFNYNDLFDGKNLTKRNFYKYFFVEGLDFKQKIKCRFQRW